MEIFWSAFIFVFRNFDVCNAAICAETCKGRENADDNFHFKNTVLMYLYFCFLLQSSCPIFETLKKSNYDGIKCLIKYIQRILHKAHNQPLITIHRLSQLLNTVSNLNPIAI